MPRDLAGGKRGEKMARHQLENYICVNELIGARGKVEMRLNRIETKPGRVK